MEPGTVHNDHDHLSDHDRREHHIDEHPATDDNFKTLDLNLDAEYLRTAFNLDGTPYFDLGDAYDGVYDGTDDEFVFFD